MTHPTTFGHINAHYAIPAAHAENGGIVNFNFGERGNLEKDDSIDAITEKSLRVEKQKCLHSLSFRNIDARLHDVAPAHRDTCDWLFDTNQFRQWRDRRDLSKHNGVLWIKGKPGAGKSTLMKHIWRHRNKLFQEYTVAAYFFNARGDNFEKTSLGLLRSVMHQFLDQDANLYERFIPLFRPKAAKYRNNHWQWRESELREFLLSNLNCFGRRPVLLLVDALDECNETEVERVVDLLEYLSLNARGVNANLSICLSSRHYPHIGMARALELVLEKKEGHDRDIEIYVSDKLKEQDGEIVSRILKKSSGIFMWVVLVIVMLNQAYLRGQMEAMHQVLDKVPRDLEHMFHAILNAGGSDWPETVIMMQLVLFAERPLMPTELLLAALAGTSRETFLYWYQKLATQPNSAEVLRRITSSSRGLIEIRRGELTVQFIHESVRDFLLRYQRLKTLDPALESNPIGTSHDRIKQCCLEYLTMLKKIPIPSNPTVRSGTHLVFPFLTYASEFIFVHAETAQVCGIQQISFLQHLRRNNDIYLQIRQLRRILLQENMPGKDAKLMHFLVFHRYQRLVVEELSNASNPGNNVAEYNNALEVAVMRDELGILSLLLARGADINVRGAHYHSALIAAVALANNRAVQLLLKARANANIECPVYGTALQSATMMDKKDIVKQLLEGGADINRGGGPYGNALMAAIVLERLEIAKVLVEEGADVDKIGGFYATPLQAAVRQGQHDIVGILLSNGADINRVCGPFRTALNAAIHRKDEQMTRILLENGAKLYTDIVKCRQDEQSLRIAAQRSNFVKLLLKTGSSKRKLHSEIDQRLNRLQRALMPPFHVEYMARQLFHVPLGVLLPFHLGASRKLHIISNAIKDSQDLRQEKAFIR